MPRKLREEIEGGIYHVYARGNDRRVIFVDDVDRQRYLGLLGKVVERQRWWCLGFCLMPNHVHLLLETPRTNLATGMQRLHGGYAQAFNKRHGSVGHLFQGRYGAVRVISDPQLWTVIGYIVRNPVTAGLCGRPEAWDWGSHVAATRTSPPPWLHHRRLIGLLSGTYHDPEAAYARLAGEGIAAPDLATL